MLTGPGLDLAEEVKSEHASELEPADGSHSKDRTEDSKNNSHTKPAFEPEPAKHSALVGASEELLKPPKSQRPPQPPTHLATTRTAVTSQPVPVQDSQKETDIEEDTLELVSGIGSLHIINTKISEKNVLGSISKPELVYNCIGEKELAKRIKRFLGEDDKYWYKFLGECYIHGMMDGQAMAHQNSRMIPARVFELR